VMRDQHVGTAYVMGSNGVTRSVLVDLVDGCLVQLQVAGEASAVRMTELEAFTLARLLDGACRRLLRGSTS
jgi:hypothetical protein